MKNSNYFRGGLGKFLISFSLCCTFIFCFPKEAAARRLFGRETTIGNCHEGLGFRSVCKNYYLFGMKVYESCGEQGC